VMEKLAKLEGYPIEVVNLGRPGIDLAFYEGVARQYIDVLEPDLITVGVFLGDDIPAQVVRPVNIVVGRKTSLKEKLKSNFKFLNYVFRLLKQYIPALHSDHFKEVLRQAQKQHDVSDRVVTDRQKRIEPKIIEMAKSDTINPWDLVNGLILPNRYQELITLDPKSNAVRHIEALFIVLKRLNNYAKQRKIPVVFITIPIRLQVSEIDQRYFNRLGVKTGANLIGNTPLQKKLSAMMKSNRLLYFDMLPALRAAKRDLFIPLDTHLNNAGQDVAGTQFYQYLKKQKLLPKGR